jgi:hypothetical protein
MKRLTKQCLGCLLGLGLAGSGWGFSLLGPYKAWQVTALGYSLPNDIGAPMTLSEGYRWNVPTITYAYDQSFVAYFGSNGMVAVDKAIAMLNGLPPMALVTNDASQLYIRGVPVPYDAKKVNDEAGTLGLLDVKSAALGMLLEELGLAESVRWAFSLRNRWTETIAGVTYTNYIVVKYNYDPITRQPSSYVNGTLYTYQIYDPILPINYADAIESPAIANFPIPYSPVAGWFPTAGEFAFGLTHDDVGGLRFLYNTNNLATETLLTNVVGGLGASNCPWCPYLGTNTTNFFLQGTNIFFNTNALGTNLINQGLRPGINKIFFQKVSYDSIIGQGFLTITNNYTDTIISNARPVIQPVSRLIGAPDIIFVAGDLGLFNNYPILALRTDTTDWVNNDAINGQITQGGPGVIPPQVVISFSDQLPYFENQSPSFLDELSAFRSEIWGSFDETANPPIIYPDYGGLTLRDLQNYVLGRTGN